MSDIAIKVENLSKLYKLGAQKSGSFRESFTNIFKKQNLENQSQNSENEFWALNDVSFEIKKGEAVGIIGRNGAGKSTLLKVLSRITEPTKGRIQINGRVASLLEVGTGFHPELTGRENIYLNGTILGMSRAEVRAKFDEIVDFSGVEKFIDTPVKHYSSGMYVRLAFAVAAHLEPEILIIDEVLAVGDAEFQKKCLGKMEDVTGQGRTVLFVSHNMSAVKSFCTNGILLRKGQVFSQGNISPVIQDYITSGDISSVYIPLKIDNKIDITFKRIEILNKSNQSCSEFTCEDNIKIKFDLSIQRNKNYSLFVIIKDRFGAPVFSAEKNIEQEEILLNINRNFLTRGNYCIHTFIHIPKLKQIDIAKDICFFNVSDSTSELAIHGEYNYGTVFGNYSWE